MGGTNSGCGKIIDFDVNTHEVCNPIYRVEMAAATRLGVAAVPLPPSSYAIGVEHVKPCPWNAV